MEEFRVERRQKQETVKWLLGGIEPSLLLCQSGGNHLPALAYADLLDVCNPHLVLGFEEILTTLWSSFCRVFLT